MKKSLRRLLPILLAVGLLVWTLRGVPFSALLGQLRLVSPVWIAGATLMIVVQTGLRALRWNMMLRSLAYRPSQYRTLIALLSGNVASLILPGSGELTRCSVLSRTDAIPLPQSIGSVVAERLADLLALAVLLLLTLAVQADRLTSYLTQWVRWPAWVSATPARYFVLMAVGGLMLLVASLWLGQPLGRRLWQRYNLRPKLDGLRQGLLSITRVRNLPLFILVNLAIHGLSLGFLALLFRALPSTEALSVSAALTVFAVTTLGSLTIPTQASLGSFHFLASRALLAYNVPLTDGVIWATFAHAVLTIPNLVLSLLGFGLAMRVLNQRSIRQTDRIDTTA